MNTPHRPALTTILCDLDGTLVDSHRDIAASFQHAMRGLTDAELPDAAAISRQIGKPLEVMVSELGFTLSPQHLETFLHTYRSYFSVHGTQYAQPYPTVESTLVSLSTMSLGVVTAKAQKQAEIFLQELKLSHHFGHIQGSQPGLRHKPAPDSVEVALHALQCPPEQALMVGDTPADILAGKSASVRTCAVTYGFGDLEHLRACEPDYVIDLS